MPAHLHLEVFAAVVAEAYPGVRHALGLQGPLHRIVRRGDDEP